MTDFLDGLGDVLISGAQGAAKGAAAGSIVPGFGTALGAAAGAVIGVAPQISKWVFGADAEPTIAAVKQAVTDVTGTPDPAAQVEALKDNGMADELRVRLAALAAAREAQAAQSAQAQLDAILADRQGARKTMTDLAEKKSPLAYGAAVMSIGVVATFLYMFHLLLSSKMPVDPDLKTVVIGMIITVQTAYAGAVGYWIGSSAGSAAKDRRNARGQ